MQAYNITSHQLVLTIFHEQVSMNRLLQAEAYGEGIDLILLHGLFGSKENLRSLGRQLSTHYRIHALDLRNHGQSFHADSMNYMIMANDVFKYMHKNNINQAHVMGHSMGGKVAMQMALMLPEKIHSLMVMDIAPVDYTEYGTVNRHDNILNGLQALEKQKITSRSEADRILMPYVKNDIERSFLLKNIRRKEDKTLYLRLNIKAIVCSYNAIQAAPSGNPFKKPVLFIKGEESDYICREYKEKTIDLFPEAKLKIIPGTGHWIHAEKPLEIADMALEFLSVVKDVTGD